METIQDLDHLTMAIYLITAILGLIALILAVFLLINDKEGGIHGKEKIRIGDSR